MLTFKVFVFITTISVAIGEVDHTTECKNDYRDENNIKIIIAEYCSKKLCIEKCCGKDGLFNRYGRCISKTKHLKSPKILAKYDAITNVLSSENATKIPPRDYVYIYNSRNLNNCTAEHDITDEYQILEDGSLKMRGATGTKQWSTINRLTYCIDYKIYFKSNESREPFVKIIIREFTADPKDTDKIVNFETGGIIISSFFLLLLLIVYCLLPELRNLSGLALMSYTFSLLFAYTAKVILNLISNNPPPKFCERMSPVLYFGCMSSIFWLSVISFDVWLALRTVRVSRGTKNEDRVRFLWYGLYAWGTPLLITAIVVALDKSPLVIVKPPFESCFQDGPEYNYYLRIPLGILIIMNTVLFIVTIAHIWMVKHAINNQNSSKRQNTKFSTYAKLSTIMGVNWCLELIPTDNITWMYILVTMYIFVGVALFCFFVCQRRTLALLCKKYNIKHEITKYLDTETSRRDKISINTKSSFLSRFTFKSKSRKEQNHDVKTEETPKNEIALV